MRKIVGKIGGALLLCVVVLLIYLMLRGGKVRSEPTNEIILMPDSEFAENPVLFRTQDGTLTAPVIDKNNCKQILTAIRRPADIYWEVESSMRTPDGSERTTGRFFAKNGRTRTELLSSGGRVVKTAISDGKTVLVRTDEGSRTTDNLSLYKPETIMQMSDIEFFISCDPKNILKAEIVSYKGFDCLYVSYKFPELNQTENYYISLKFGLPIYAETLSAGLQTYTAETVKLEASEQSASLFNY